MAGVTIGAETTSKVLATAAADPKVGQAYFLNKLAMETDPSDVYHDLKHGLANFVIVDARSPESYARGHIPTARNLWHKNLDATAAAALPKDKTIITYCTGVGCNASTKAAAKLAALGFRVKEMTGGLTWWRDNEKYPVATGPEPGRL